MAQDQLDSPTAGRAEVAPDAPLALGGGVRAVVTRSLLGLSGLGLLIGFFLPWIRFGNMVVLSGFSLWATSGEAVEVISGPRRTLLFMVPLSALALIACAATGHRVSIWVALVTSIALIAYGAFTMIRLFLDTTGFGMWLVVLSTLTAFAVGLVNYGGRTTPR